MRVFTIGYEGLDLDELTALLARHGVETVVDVREMPLSRKPGFSKQALRHELQLSGFGYVHIAALGCPKPVREGYRQHGDWARYTEGFTTHLKEQKQAVAQLAELAQVTTCALLCFEADPNLCHRALVAEALCQRAGVELEHIPVKGAASKAARTKKDAEARNLSLF